MHVILLNGKCKEMTPSVSGSYMLPIFCVNPLLELSKNIILIIYLKLSEFSFNLFPILSVNFFIKKSQSLKIKVLSTQNNTYINIYMNNYFQQYYNLTNKSIH